MTKNEIIRELSNCNLARIKSLYVVLRDSSSHVRYSFSYENDLPLCSAPFSDRCELVKFVFSAYKLRKFIDFISVVYSSSDGKSCVRRFADYSCVLSISDFIESIKK